MLRINETIDISYNIICFGLMPWNKMWKRNQSMMAELSKCDFVHRVLYVNPTVSLRSHFRRRREKFSVSIEADSYVFPWQVSPNITVYQPVTFLPFKAKFQTFLKIEELITYNVIHYLNGEMPFILFMNCPNVESHYLLDKLLAKSKFSIFDFSDDFAALGNDCRTKATFHRNSLKYASAATMVLAVNEHVKNKYSKINPNIHVIRNATNYENFNRGSYPPIEQLEKIKQKGWPIIGYSGISNMGRIDGAILDFLLKQRPNWQFVFVGPSHPNFVDRYSTYRNIHILAPVVYKDLPHYLRYFDVAIVPFQRNENTEGNDLLKLHDYLAMGKPVVSTNIGGALDLKNVIRIAENPQAFLRSIEDGLGQIHSEEVVGQRKDVAFKNSWFARISELESLIKGSLEGKSG